MKLSTLTGPSNLSPAPSAHDIDAGVNVAPAIGKHIGALETLLPLLPGNEEVCQKLEELKALLSSGLSMSVTVIEAEQTAPVIIDYDENKPLGQQRAHIHGVGTASVGHLPTKIIREAGFVGDVISEIGDLESRAPDYDELIEKYNELGRWTNQLLRTTTTLKQACSEMARKRQSSPRSRTLEDQPTAVSGDIDRMIADNFVMTMYENMRIGLGDKAWVAISKRLRSQGIPKELAEQIVNRAIAISEKAKG